jgi:hypothetical protein
LPHRAVTQLDDMAFGMADNPHELVILLTAALFLRQDQTLIAGPMRARR